MSGNVRGRGQAPGRGRGGQDFPPRGRGGGGGGGRGFESRGGGGGGRGRGVGGPVIFAENVPAQVHPRLSMASLQQLITGFKSLSVKHDRPLRPGYGTLGTPITLRTNFFAVKIPQGPIYDYTVEISPSTDFNKLKARIFQLLELSPVGRTHLPYIAHDHSQRLVSARKLPQPLIIPIKYYEDHQDGPSSKGKIYTVSITFQRELDPRQLTRYMDGAPEFREFDPLPLISALNIVLQQHATRTGVRVGKNRFFFLSQAEKIILGPGLEAVQGFYSSVRPAQQQLMVNVNVCMTAFIEPGNLAERLFSFSRNSRDAMPTLPKAMMKSISVRVQHLGYKRKLHAIGTTSARNTYFDCEEFGGKISVEQYFLKKYQVKLKHGADLPVVDLGSANRKNWVPAELCDIEPGNAFRGKLTDNETAQMIRYACNPPKMNAEAIVGRGFPALGLAPATTPTIGFGISVDTAMAVVPGREFNAPSLTYRAGNARVQNGSWNILDVKFHRGGTVSTWWVLVVRDGKDMLRGPTDPNLKGLVEGFRDKLKKSGVTMPDGMPRLLPPAKCPSPQQDPGRAEALNNIRQILREASRGGPKPSFILVLLENRDNFIYPGIKRIGDVEFGVNTIHMQLGKALGDVRKQDQYFSNVALKVNTKLGGMNHLLDERAMRWLTKKKTMMVGIDVTHPGPGSREGTPSIAAVVASVDDSFVQFPASLRIQASKKEVGYSAFDITDRIMSNAVVQMLDELTDMLVERLLVYEKKNKVFPDRIFVYRDGVSEGQFDIVIMEELPQILNAFKKLNTRDRKKAYRPQLSIIICGKRHHAKFYPTTSQFADRNGNTRPGTVVDKGITDVFNFDFYLQAHAGLQGNVKATHYTVVYDENNLSADDIQQGTHDASYLYARATKAVSLIPAAYYADLACERGRCYLNDFLVDDKTSTTGSTKGDRKEEESKVFAAARRAWGEGLHPDMRGTMFYI